MRKTANNVSMQGIEFQIVNDSAGAVVGIEQLKKSLEGLKASLGSGSGSLGTVAKNIGKIRDALAGLNTAKLANLATALDSLKQKTEGLKISASIGNQLAVISRAINNLPDVTGSKLAQLADGLRPLSELGKTNLGSFITQLKKLPEVAAEIDKIDMDKFATQMAMLAEAMRPLADQMAKVSAGFAAFPSRIQRLITSTERYNNVVYGAANGTSRWGSALKAVSFVTVTKSAASLLAKAINKASEYTEALNMFSVSMGTYNESAYEYAQTVSDVMGIDPAAWMENQGVFNSIITGFGVAADKAAVMSKNLTQLGYDLSSFYNISVEDAIQKVQSGISGELEPLRRLGYDLSVARLQQEALNLGIEKSVSDMTQAEKAQLRYHAMLTQVTMVQGDMARTLEQPANQLRVLKMQVEQAARAFGNLFIPILNKVLPVAIAVAQAVREVIASIAALFGIDMAESVDFSESAAVSAGATEEIAESVDDAAASAKKLKSYLMGFDELNVLSADDGSGSGIEGVGGSSIDLQPLDYDFLSGAVTQRIDEIKTKIEPLVSWVKENMDYILELAKNIAVVFLGWKLTKDFISAIDAVRSLSNMQKLTIGIALTLGGFAIEYTGIEDALKNGLDGLNFASIVAGGLFGTAGAAYLTSKFITWLGAAMTSPKVAFALAGIGTKLGVATTGALGAVLGASVAGIVAGIPMIITGIYDAITDGIDGLSAALTALGTTLTGAAIGLIVAGPVGAGIGALIGLAAGALTDLGILVYQKWDEITGFLGGIGEWFSTNVIEPVKSFFAPAVEWIGTIFEGAWIVAKAAWSIAAGWFNEKVIQPVKGFFSQLWTDIKAIFAPLVDWFTNTVTVPLTTAFSTAWKTIKEAFKTAFTWIGEFAKSVLNGLISKVERTINRVIDAINSLLNGFNRVVSCAADVLGMDWRGVELLSSISLPRLANGGVVDAGQVFIAREAGPELVASVGRRTAVANNEQIVDMVAGGVVKANSEGNRLLREQNELLRAILAKETGVVLDGRTLLRSTEKASRARGAVIMAGGVTG